MNENKRVQRVFLLMRSLLTGFIAGLFWSILGVIMYYFNFTEVTPKTFILRPWKNIEWTNGWLGDIVSIVTLAILSIGVAFIYYSLFKKLPSIWMGVIYGCIIWVVFFMLIQPLFPNVKQLSKLSKETIITTVSLFILYGTFIGYSISYDYYDTFTHRKGESPKKT